MAEDLRMEIRFELHQWRVVLDGGFMLTIHAMERMVERRVGVDDVFAALQFGTREVGRIRHGVVTLCIVDLWIVTVWRDDLAVDDPLPNMTAQELAAVWARRREAWRLRVIVLPDGPLMD